MFDFFFATWILSQLIIKSKNTIFSYFVRNENYKICNKTLSQPLCEIDYNILNIKGHNAILGWISPFYATLRHTALSHIL